MQSLMFLGCFDQKLSKKNLWGEGIGSTPPFPKGRVKLYYWTTFINDFNSKLFEEPFLKEAISFSFLFL